MSNPFDKELDDVPGVSQRRREAATKADQAASEAARQEAIDLHEQNRLLELSRYEHIVVSTLEKLRDSAYPGYVITKDLTEGRWPRGRNTPSYWELCKSETHTFRSPHQSEAYVSKELYPVIGVDLVCGDTGIAEQFVVRHHVDNHGHANSREVRQRRELLCPLTEESLIEALKQVHSPTRRVELLREYHPQIVAMLQKLLASDFGILFGALSTIHYPSIFDRLKNDPYSVEEYSSLGASWAISVDALDYPIGVPPHKFVYTPDYSTGVEVSLVEGDNPDSSQDRFDVVVSYNASENSQTIQFSTPTDQDDLKTAIDGVLIKLLPKRKEYITTLRSKQKKR